MQPRRSNSSTSIFGWLMLLLPLFLSLIAVAWLLVVMKVFMTDYKYTPMELKIDQINHMNEVPSLSIPDKHVDFVPYVKDNQNLGANKPIDIPLAPSPPRPVEQAHFRKEKADSPIVEHNVVAPLVKQASDLTWPPVFSDGTIPEGDGFDIMPLTGLKVPRFWRTRDDVDMNVGGTHVNGEETIFLMIASYRDFQCRETITSAFERSDHPERLFIGAVDQIVPGDIGCLDIDIPCSTDPNQMICKYRSQISVYNMDASVATGPVTARHIGDRMYRGQYYVMQMDAHCLFIRHWDEKLISQFRSTGNEMAVLTSYLTDIQGSIDVNGDSRRNTRPIMCNSDFEGIAPARYLRHGSQPEDFAIIRGMPQLEPYWAAGFSFSRGHFTERVPYDGFQPMVFQGEEIALGIRGFTHGYDFYAPVDSVVFHEYAEKSKRRKKIHMFWENSPQHKGAGQASLKRSMGVIHMAHDMKEEDWDHSEVDRYGLGTGIMHRAFQPFLRADGLGIDYSSLEDYDTRKYLNERLRQLGQPEV